MCAVVHAWRLEDTLGGVHCVGPGDQIQIIRFENKCPTLTFFTLFLMSKYLTMRGVLELSTETQDATAGCSNLLRGNNLHHHNEI